MSSTVLGGFCPSCEDLYRIYRAYAIPRVVCVLVLITQTGLLDYYLVTYIDSSWFLWLLFDSVVVALFTASAVLSYRSVL